MHRRPGQPTPTAAQERGLGTCGSQSHDATVESSGIRDEEDRLSSSLAGFLLTGVSLL